MTAMRPLLLSLLFVSLAAGCGGSEAADVSRFSRPGAPPTYWLGDSFDGLLLETTDAGTGARSSSWSCARDWC